MRVFVTTPEGKTLTIEVEPSDTLDIVMAKIQDKIGIPFNKEMVLTFEEKKLVLAQTVSYYNIQNESTIQLAFASA
ncbi:ubiquitin [Suillus ampliporus]|nr:ubiquitin [Suillus ampliporus]